ncbi:uncharacterized protein LOC107610305 [Arachis ipaensis]|uniref:uncharacterized protein LOC107610305 n=1 Tax=Arachis ipaensis TaxID=130454 RepID=UPI000A2B9799|nr:uncharacterized protein LOC107610305 [Arachis ipaensis]
MVVKGLGYTQSQVDHTLFYKYSAANKTAILIVYVDDIILTGDAFLELKDLKEKLAKAFEIKELGSLKYFLGIEFARSKEDIAFAVSMVSQFMHSPGQEHMYDVFRILRYLKGSPGKGLLYKKYGHLQVEAYTDVDWAGNVMDRRSTSGYCTIVGGNLCCMIELNMLKLTSILSGKRLRGQICISYVPTTEQLVDVLTKGLSKKTFDSIISKLSMNDIFKSA